MVLTHTADESSNPVFAIVTGENDEWSYYRVRLPDTDGYGNDLSNRRNGKNPNYLFRFKLFLNHENHFVSATYTFTYM